MDELILALGIKKDERNFFQRAIALSAHSDRSIKRSNCRMCMYVNIDFSAILIQIGIHTILLYATYTILL